VQAIADDDESLSSLARARWIDKTIDQARYNATHSELSERRDRNERRLAAINRRTSMDLPTDFGPWWSAAPMETRRRALRLFID
jgi:hypothetical protein